MAQDLLVLGGFIFENTDYSPPDVMMGGGKHAMVVHKLPGGSRVIDTLGPDNAQIVWRGFFFGNSAYSKALTIDGMRSAGSVISLSWGGQAYAVIIEEFIYRVHRLPTWVEYNISCTVAQNPQQGNLTPNMTTTDQLVQGDLGAAQDQAGGFNVLPNAGTGGVPAGIPPTGVLQ